MKKCLLNLLLAMVLLPSMSIAQSEDYPVVFDKSQDYTHKERRLNGASLNGSADGSQSVTIPAPLKVYSYVADGGFTARAGETLTPAVNYSGTWMHGYVYIDYGRDGAFDFVYNADGSYSGDVVSFSYAEHTPGSGSGYNSAGEAMSAPNSLTTPAFTLPANLANGFYLMRFKVDWASIDPAGRAEDGNGILKNGGGIMDVRLNVHGENCTVNATSENGTLLSAGGAQLENYAAPFGKDFTVKIAPADGYVLDYIKVRHGYNLDGERLVHGVAQYDDMEVPGIVVLGGEYTIPAEVMNGDVVITAYFVKSADGGTTGEKYIVAVDADAASEFTGFTLNDKTFTVEGGKKYTNIAPAELPVLAGGSISGQVPEGKNYYLYIDLNNDGYFTSVVKDDGSLSLSSELVSFNNHNGKNSLGEAASNALPAYTLPSLVGEGNYRARLKVDSDNLSSAGGENCEAIVDFLVNVHDGEGEILLYSTNGNIYGSGSSALPLSAPLFTKLAVLPKPVFSDYSAEEMRIRHGHRLNAPQFDENGNQQWSEYSVKASLHTIKAENVNGDIAVYVDYVANEDAEYQLVFSDEFNGEDGTQPTSEKWVRCKRQSATWNRWLSDSEEVVYIEDGKLVTRAIPNPDTSVDNVPMITGGVWTRGIFGFTYGRLECRLLTNPWKGNFPALWLMPEDQSKGWPNDGEIDIFESIDAQNRAWHTVHSNWTYNLGNKNNPKSSFDEAVSLDRYHTYALEWDEDELIWYVDGKQVARYAKSTAANVLNQGQWPFDDNFHIILNQSVGNGSWAANADVNHTYETLFDWVRVYQKVGMENTEGTVGIKYVTADENVKVVVVDGGVLLSGDDAHVVLCDVAGRVILDTQLGGERFVALQAGVYIVNGEKYLLK